MTPSLLIRPVVVFIAASGLSACGMINSDPHRFENLARSVAAIDLDGQGERAAPTTTSADLGLRPPLRVEVMDPHSLWDARDGVDTAIERAAPQLIAAAAPAVDVRPCACTDVRLKQPGGASYVPNAAASSSQEATKGRGKNTGRG